MPKPLTTPEFIANAKEVHNGKYDYSLVDYKNNKTKVDIICLEHGRFEQRPNQHLKGNGCPLCANKKRAESKCFYDTEMFIERVKRIHGTKYDYSLVCYRDYYTKVTIICPIHGEFEQKPSKHIKGQGCFKCSYQQRAAQKRSSYKHDFIQKARQVHGDKYDYSKVVYNNSEDKIDIICKKHGVFKQSPAHHLNGSGCMECSGRLKLTAASIIEKANKIHNNRYDYNIPYEPKNNKQSITVVCGKHGEFHPKIHNHLNGSGCPVCSYEIVNRSSSKEEDVKSYLESFISNVKCNVRYVIPPYELDMYVPSKDIAIEFDGLYWHSESVRQDKFYHLNKTNDCLKKGVTLIHIFENEWDTKQEIVKSRLKQILGETTNKIYGRNCRLVNVDRLDEKNFFDRNHLQGYVPSKICLGLEFENDLVACMSFGKPRYNKSFTWELLRFCNVVDYAVVGGASKLFKGFLTDNKGSIVSYADRRWSQGNLYDKLGFTFYHYSNPNYFYFRGNVLESRVKYQKHKLKGKLNKFDPNLTEAQNMKMNGYNRIFDCGNAVYVYHK